MCVCGGGEGDEVTDANGMLSINIGTDAIQLNTN